MDAADAIAHSSPSPGPSSLKFAEDYRGSYEQSERSATWVDLQHRAFWLPPQSYLQQKYCVYGRKGFWDETHKPSYIFK